MDIDHIQCVGYQEEIEPPEPCTVCGQGYDDFEAFPEDVAFGKKVFQPNLPFLRSLNPRQLTIQAHRDRLKSRGDFLSFYILPATAEIISFWPRLRLIDFKSALLHTTQDDDSIGRNHRLLPLPRSSRKLSRVLIQVHLSSDYSARLPLLKDAYTLDFAHIVSCDLLTYLFTTLRQRTSNPVFLCYSDQRQRKLLVDEKEKLGPEWPAHIGIFSKKTLEIRLAETLKRIEAEVARNGGVRASG